jgi:hypothetical protein
MNNNPHIQEILGYEAIPQVEFDLEEGSSPAYILRSMRGREIELYRNYEHPHMLVAINRKQMAQVSIKGFTYFTDKNGRLAPVS